MSYYLDMDLKKGLVYIAPLVTPAEGHFIIQFQDRYSADNYLKKLVSRLRKPPFEDPKSYRLLEVLESKKGKVSVFELL